MVRPLKIINLSFQEGQAFLDKNLTEWKKPYLADHFETEDVKSNSSGAKPKMSKHTTMKGTAKVIYKSELSLD